VPPHRERPTRPSEWRWLLIASTALVVVAGGLGVLGVASRGRTPWLLITRMTGVDVRDAAPTWMTVTFPVPLPSWVATALLVGLLGASVVATARCLRRLSRVGAAERLSRIVTTRAVLAVVLALALVLLAVGTGVVQRTVELDPTMGVPVDPAAPLATRTIQPWHAMGSIANWLALTALVAAGLSYAHLVRLWRRP